MKERTAKTCWHRILAGFLAISMVLIPVHFPGHAHAVEENTEEHVILFEDDFDASYSWSYFELGSPSQTKYYTHTIVDSDSSASDVNGALNIYLNYDQNLHSLWLLNCVSDGQDVDKDWSNYTVSVDVKADRTAADGYKYAGPGIAGRVTPVYEDDGETVKGYTYYEVCVMDGRVQIYKPFVDLNGADTDRGSKLVELTGVTGTPSGTQCKIEVTFSNVVDEETEQNAAKIDVKLVYSDKEQTCTYTDTENALTTGGVGLAFGGGSKKKPLSAQYDNFQVTQDGSLIFKEDFGTETIADDTATKAYMQKTKSVKSGLVSGIADNWSVTDSAYASTVANSVSYVAADGADAWTDYIVEAELALSGEGALIARYSEDGYYEMRVNANGTVGLYRSGNDTPLKTYTGSVFESPVKAKLEVLGTKLIGSIEGEVVVEYNTANDADKLTAGTAGVASGTGVAYNNFSVIAHVWPENWITTESTHSRTCTVTDCGTTYVAEHVSADDGDCTTAVLCSVCAKEITAAQTDHVYGEETTDGGLKIKKCNNCDITAAELDAVHDADQYEVAAESTGTSANVTMGTGVLEQIANKSEGTSLFVNSNILDLTFDNTALKKIVADHGNDANVTIAVNNVTPAGTENKLRFDINLKVNGVSQESYDFGEGNVTVAIPLDSLNLTQDQTVEVWYVKDGKRTEKMAHTQENSVVTFQTNHFSEYEASVVGAYTADISADKTAMKVDENVAVTINVGGTTGSFASSQIELSYDPDILTFDAEGSHTLNGATVSANNGVITIVDHGDSQNNGAAYVLNFTAKAAAEPTEVALVSAGFSTAENAATENLTPIADTNVLNISVTPADLTVTLGEGLKSDDGEAVVYNGSYTFYAEDPNYDYTISVNDGTIIPDYNEGTGVWTIANVTENLNITITKQDAKKFGVTISDTDAIVGDPVTGNNAATYKVDYTFTLKDDVAGDVGTTGYQYNVTSITIGGKEVNGSWSQNDRVVTIYGDYITGDIEITTEIIVTEPGSFSITVNGGNELSAPAQVNKNENVTLTLDPIAGYNYEITINGTNVPLDDWTFNENNGTYTYTIENVTANVTVTHSKQLDLSAENVTVSPYLTLNGKTIYLVQVTTKLDSGYVYTYNGQNMYWSEKYNDANGANAFLVIMDNESEGVEQTLELNTAIANINITTGSATTVDYSGNVNMADASTVDANDAQLVYNMYQTKSYNEFTTAVTMEKFLRADVNGSGTITVEDATAIVNTIHQN